MGGDCLIETELSLVAQFYDPLEAEIASGLLRAGDVPCFLSGEGAGTAFPVRLGRLGRIDLMVRSEDASRAKRLLEPLGPKSLEPTRTRGRRKNQGNSSSNH